MEKNSEKLQVNLDEMERVESLQITPKPFQEGFLNTGVRYPGFVAAWGTGKTLFAILRGLRLCTVPNNLGLIVRKEFTDLRDSTIKDFEESTGLKLNSDKNVMMPDGSMIMFRHGKELDVLKNINLGWFLIEQAEEFENDEQFQYLRGRLRRKIGYHCGMVIANVKGHNWIWKLWKASPPSAEYKLWEATTFDNADNLPASYIKDLETMKKESPVHYNRFVLNSWDELEIGDIVIPFSDIIESQKVHIDQPLTKKIIVVDPAEMGDDETVIYALENEKLIDEDIFVQKRPMETVGRIIAMKRKHKANLIVGDAIGVGSGIFSRLDEMNEPTLPLRVSENAADPSKYFNVRAEIWWYAREQFQERKPDIFDEILMAELSAIKHFRNSKGQIQIEKKEEIRKADRLGRSPSRADAWVMGLWGLQFATPLEKVNKMDAYRQKKEVGGYMSA